MGIDHWNLQFLLESHKTCGSFGDTLQIGRQELHIGHDGFSFADELFRRYGHNITYAEANQGNRYADEGLLQFFGATNIKTADASAYEGAEIIHDFNEPIPFSFYEKFDTVFDAGSLEHIFNIPCAIGNEMNMVKVGGRLLSTLPANNWLGHGFYQFSQEFPYRVFTPSNGFSVIRAYFSGMADNHELLVIDDLARRAGGEIGVTGGQTGLMVIALKSAHLPLFKRWPQQGDYRSEWDKYGDFDDNPSGTAVSTSQKSVFSRIARKLGLAP